MAVHRTSISLQDRLYEKGLKINAELLLKHKVKSQMATLLAALLEMYDDKKHGAELRKALADSRKQDGRTTRHKKRNKSVAEQIMSSPAKKKKKADTKAALAKFVKGRR
jgi:hypothetical protein